MAELVSVRSSNGTDSNNPEPATTEIAIDNPAYSNEADSAEPSSEATLNGVANPTSVLKGTTISFRNVSFIVDTKIKKKKVKKEIVKGISGIFPPGMNAILGPTGCGKTTTLDMLADRKDMSQVSGDIMVNGRKKPSNFKRMTGYVVQHDVVMGLLTVRENIYFSAALRLPSSMSSEEKAQKVDKLIEELGLSKVANSKVGTEMVRGISGGEKRRTGIGMELIISPHVLFLDEPTTGLDASTASSVMQLLHDLSRKGNTIIFSIHQPRYSIFKLFDNVCLLGDGHMIYNGPAQEALGYFREIGYECEAHNNPPDFFLDVINSARIQTEEGDEENQNEMEKGSVTTLNLAQRFKESSQGQAIEKQVNEIYNEMMKNPDAEVTVNEQFEQLDHFATGWFKQLAIVGQRSIRCLTRNPITTIVQLIVMAFLGVVVGALYFQMDKDEKGIQNRVGAFFFIVMNMVYANLDSIELLLKEKPIFVHETASGYYRVSVYFLAKIFGEFLPYRACSAFVFAVIAYWMAGFDSDAGRFFIFALTLIQVSACGCSFAFLLSATFGIFAIANLMAAVLYTIMLVFGGLLLNQESFGDWIGWLRYLSIFKYGMECLEINELDGMTFDCPKNASGTNGPILCLTGTEYLDSQGIEVDMLWWNQLILFAMSFICCFLTYVQLRRVKKDK